MEEKDTRRVQAGCTRFFGDLDTLTDDDEML